MIEECDRTVMFELLQTTDLSKWQGGRNDPAWLAFIEVIKKRLAATPAPSKGSESRGGRPAAEKPRKRAKSPKQQQCSDGLLTAVMLTFIFGTVSAAGFYILRPDLVAPVLTQLSALTAPESAEAEAEPAAAASLAAEVIPPPAEKVAPEPPGSPSSRRPPSPSSLLSANAICART